MDGLAKSTELVFLLAATNLPWELDSALLRRLEKRILVPLPSAEARARMLEALLPPQVGTVEGEGPRRAPGVAVEPLAERMEGYSGSDVFLVAKEAAMRPLRRVMAKLELLPDGPLGAAAGAAAAAGAGEATLGPITEEDLGAALAASRPTAHLFAERYSKFEREFGQAGGGGAA